MSSFDQHYASISDMLDVKPTNPVEVYGGNAAIVGLRAFRGYNKDARYEYRDVSGVLRWMTPKMMRIEAVLLRVGTVGSGYTKTADIAQETQCSRGYVSKMIARFQAWGVVGVISTRGRYGKLFVFAREAGDKLDHFMEWAKRKLSEAKIRRVARFVRKTNVSSTYTNAKRVNQSQLPRGLSMEETLVDGWVPATLSTFARRVVHERARLAIDDPEGEAEAVAPLTEERAHYLFSVTFDPPPAPAVHGTELVDALGLDTTRGSGRIPCPAHGEGRSKTLAWRITSDGRVLLHCFAGCTFGEIRKAILG